MSTGSRSVCAGDHSCVRFGNSLYSPEPVAGVRHRLTIQLATDDRLSTKIKNPHPAIGTKTCFVVPPKLQIVNFKLYIALCASNNVQFAICNSSWPSNAGQSRHLTGVFGRRLGGGACLARGR